MTAALAERGFAVDWLAFCIADDGNGEPFFVYGQTGTVFVYNWDGMDVEEWAASLDLFTAELNDRTDDKRRTTSDASRLAFSSSQSTCPRNQ